jgi:hypothetical protein
MARLIARPETAANEGSPERGQKGRQMVPWSTRAALLAGLATACLCAGLLIVQTKADDPTAGDLNQVASLVGVDARAIGPALLLLSLWQAAQSTSFTLLATHFVSKRLGDVGLPAFTATGAATGLLSALACQLLGFGGPEHGYLYEALMGGCAGFIYRLLAGVAPISRA